MEGREPTAQRESKCAGNYKCVINTWEKWEGLNSRSEELRENCIGESADNSLGGCVYQEKKEWRMMAVWECRVRNQLLQKVGGKQLLLARKKKKKMLINLNLQGALWLGSAPVRWRKSDTLKARVMLSFSTFITMGKSVLLPGQPG